MKKLIMPSLCLVALFATSCHNYDREKTQNEAKFRADSLRKTDSLNSALTDSSDRINFEKTVQSQIDSMQAKLSSLDSTYQKKSKKEQAKWTVTHRHIKTRIERLKDKEKQAGTVAKEKWAAFKQEIDTAIYNIKYEWKNGE